MCTLLLLNMHVVLWFADYKPLNICQSFRFLPNKELQDIFSPFLTSFYFRYQTGSPVALWLMRIRDDITENRWSRNSRERKKRLAAFALYSVTSVYCIQAISGGIITKSVCELAVIERKNTEDWTVNLKDGNLLRICIFRTGGISGQ